MAERWCPICQKYVDSPDDHDPYAHAEDAARRVLEKGTTGRAEARRDVLGAYHDYDEIDWQESLKPLEDEPLYVACSVCKRLVDEEEASLYGGMCERCFEESEHAAERQREMAEQARMKELLDKGVCPECKKPTPRDQLLAQGICDDCLNRHEDEWERRGSIEASFRDEWYCYRCDVTFEGRPPIGPGRCPICGAEAGSSRFTKPMWEVLKEDRERAEELLRDQKRSTKRAATYRVRVLYNQDAQFLRPYEDGDRLVEVAETTVEAPDQLAACEEVYRRYQHGAEEVGVPEEVPSHVRSMSIGDVVEFEDGSRYSVAPSGFAKVAANYTPDGRLILDGFTVLGEDDAEEEDGGDIGLFL